MQLPTDDEREAYKRGRAAIKNLTTHDRNFNWWLDYSNAVVTVRIEAMRDAFTNQPIGTAYNANHARIMRREKLDAFDANTRKDCVAMVDNLHHPVDARRAHGILAWRSGLDGSTRAKLNHPSSILRRWKKDTEPLVEKQAGSFKEPKKDPLLDLVHDTELERDDTRRDAQKLRVLLDRVLREVDELPGMLRADIEKALSGAAKAEGPDVSKETAGKKSVLVWFEDPTLGGGWGTNECDGVSYALETRRGKCAVRVYTDDAKGKLLEGRYDEDDEAKAAAEAHYAQHLEELR